MTETRRNPVREQAIIFENNRNHKNGIIGIKHAASIPIPSRPHVYDDVCI